MFDNIDLIQAFDEKFRNDFIAGIKVWTYKAFAFVEDICLHFKLIKTVFKVALDVLHFLRRMMHLFFGSFYRPMGLSQI
jgi:hypothetical protein